MLRTWWTAAPAIYSETALSEYIPRLRRFPLVHGWNRNEIASYRNSLVNVFFLKKRKKNKKSSIPTP
jgi:hypothetical protein